MAAKKKAPAKKASAKSEGLRDPIGDALVRAERAKYGPYIDDHYKEMNYMPGDQSKRLRAYSRVTNYKPLAGATRVNNARYVARSGDASGSRGTGRSLWSRIGGGLNLRGK
jgi:hypothetical protein